MEVRKARPDDWPDIAGLNQRARRVLPQLWWWEEHLADDLFIVVERKGIVAGVLFAWPDESPVAWVRLAALDDALDAGEWLDLALPPVLEGLRRRGTRRLAWMDYGGWVGPYLEARGFKPLTEVVTLVKFDRALPDKNAVGVRLRPASDADIPAVVAVDRAAFTPHWWHSETTMRRRAAVASHFAVAEARWRDTPRENCACRRLISTALPCIRPTRAVASAHCCCVMHCAPSGEVGRNR